DEHVVQRLATPARGLDEDLHLRLHRALADILGQPAWPHGTVEHLVLARGYGIDDAILFQHGAGALVRYFAAASLRASRMMSSVPAPSVVTDLSRRATSAGL